LIANKTFFLARNLPCSKKMTFSWIFLVFLNFNIKTKLFVFTKISYPQRFWFKNKHVFRLKYHRGPKKWFFLIFFVFFQIVLSKRFFLFLLKFHILNGLILKKTCFSARNSPWTEKMPFFSFCLFFEIVTYRHPFHFYQKLISSTCFPAKKSP